MVVYGILFGGMHPLRKLTTYCLLYKLLVMFHSCSIYVHDVYVDWNSCYQL